MREFPRRSIVFDVVLSPSAIATLDRNPVLTCFDTDRTRAEAHIRRGAARAMIPQDPDMARDRPPRPTLDTTHDPRRLAERGAADGVVEHANRAVTRPRP